MIPPEMTDLLRMLDEVFRKLEGRDCDDIADDLAFYRSQVKNDFSARVVCKEIAVMCHPGAWGDRLVSGMTHAEWIRLLQELKAAAETALGRIEQRQKRS
jgi:hypothetical protein